MKKMILGIILVFSLIFSGSLCAEPYFNFEEFGGTWVDSNKDYVDDRLMCWAGAASNVLFWTGWAGFFANEDDVFDHFVDHWTDEGGWMSVAYNYWFDGTNYYEGVYGHAQIDVEGGGNFYPELDVLNYGIYRSFWNTGDAEQALPMIVNLLHNQHGVTIAITIQGIPGIDFKKKKKSPKPGPPDAHALTVWGYEQKNEKMFYLYVTDTDDGKYILSKRKIMLKKGGWYMGKTWIYYVDGLLMK